MNTVFQEMEEKGKYLPKHVRDEFDAFMDCGILAKGFLRLACGDCKKEKLVAFSCKKRGLCPSCGGRRMCDTAAHLVDNVFPEVPVRQWVISFPFNLRYLFAYNKKSLSKALQIATRTIGRFYRSEAKKRGLSDGKTGSVTLIQRFGGSLNLNIHFHILFADGVWSEDGKFQKSMSLCDNDVRSTVEKLKIRILRALKKMEVIDNDQVSDQDELALEYPGLAESISTSIQRKNSYGKKVEELGKSFDLTWRPMEGELCSYKDGFSLHAKVRIGAADRPGLEHLCRYIARPAISNGRISIDHKSGKIVYKLKRAYGNGTTHLRFTAEDFIKKLIALVPPPRVNLTRYHGVLGPHSKLRKKVVIKHKKKKKGKKRSKCRISWAKLLKRVFDFEVDRCRCGGKLKILSSILDIDVIVRIMNSLELEVYIPNPEPARGSPFFNY
jgi:hypothetical protein